MLNSTARVRPLVVLGSMKQVHTKTVANQTSGHSVEGQTGSCINPLGRPLHTRLTFVSCDGLTHRDEFNMIFCTTLTDQIMFNFKLCEGVEYSKIVFLLGCLLQCQCANSKKSVHCRCFLLILIDIWYTYIYISIYSIYIYITIIPIYNTYQTWWFCNHIEPVGDFKEGTFETSDRGTGSVTFLPAQKLRW